MELDRLYRSEARDLVRTIARRTHDSEEARDVVHDVFVRLARRTGGPGLLDRPQAYLRRIARNLLTDRHRAASRHGAAPHVAADDAALPPFDPHAQLEARDMLCRVEAAMQRLPNKTREIFVAHRIEGRSCAEIAELTGMKVKGVEKHVTKALVRLDRLMARR